MWLAMGCMSKLQLIPDSALTTTMSRLGLGFTQPLTEAVPTLKQPNCEIDHTITPYLYGTVFN
jgi:hypothetical protein